MGQAEKARAVVAQHEFRMVATTTQEKALAAVDEAAAKVAPGGLKGWMKRTGERELPENTVATTWHFKPKGQIGGKPGLLQVVFKTIGPDVLIKLQIETFAYQKGSLGMKPTFPGGKQLDALRDELVSSLGATI